LGKDSPGYKYISRFFDAAMDKIGQILKDRKMALISIQNTLANRTTVPPEHFSPICSATLVFGTPFYCLGGGIYEFLT
jgi:hypothetical protein